MRLKTFLSLGFIAHATLGNFCMMSMAIAAEMPAPHETHMEMAMTPVMPMTPADCGGCMTIRAPDEHSSPSCEGHCLSQIADTTVRSAPEVLSVAVPPSSPHATIQEAPLVTAVLPFTTAPPGSVQTETTVLML